MVWNLFGGGTAYDDQLRPFGAVKVDGFDVGTYFPCDLIFDHPLPVFSYLISTQTTNPMFRQAMSRSPLPCALFLLLTPLKNIVSSNESILMYIY